MPICCAAAMESSSRAPFGYRYRWSLDRKSTRLNSSHSQISYAVFCLKKKNTTPDEMSTALEITYTVTLQPTSTSTGPFYFVSPLEITTLNDSDLNAVSC